ncbi:MAG: hypothetical protein A3J09_02240 [Candidatus Zambryskibacteria bacterium RIFCSPLOWO2_02_FULL_51_21]|uniref:LTD domain-containing protein n=1 Tax=Candidatus Zambryskibacteria bacterium RIFCSPHIGHO2_02_FULL_43_37 TaxID=1802749 RepID=A0A1G2TGH1_9BACT|nr:MAG: hypothetical protein A3D49_00660 [Candidatus Zambryskibacteria bacterium RIFCSPHIGHO2_02_FULL_43_37]OHB07786.1 MAG: hypothetical protein A2944_00520 [Candidatus Zambryskibacteria bacterium RIFCSPLOWO2_01_FULL_52_12]OHB11353.1 MAG: hypothetical protein A3J09_02240 [Candidatus Zambryskibacteria bacterium RIFCSPLOWO2_02_FULL_51_21]
MRKNLQSGQSAVIGLIILAVLIVITITMPKDSRQIETVSSSGAPSSISSANSPSSAASSGSNGSNHISIGSGNASYAYQPYEEYITIENRGDTAVNLGGWQLRNGKDKRPYYSGSVLQRFSADVAILPGISLGPGERAIVTTGRIAVQSPYPIENFRENVCTGYIEALPDYAFVPSLTQNCPRPSLEPGAENLDRECRDFVSYFPTCQTPVFGGKDSDGEYCENCINGKRLSSSCASYLKEHFSYQGCLAYHSRDAGFTGKTWRLFLGRGWEMWADKYETIELYDSNGQLVDYQNY